jgi:hypothetical protein
MLLHFSGSTIPDHARLDTIRWEEEIMSSIPRASLDDLVAAVHSGDKQAIFQAVSIYGDALVEQALSEIKPSVISKLVTSPWSLNLLEAVAVFWIGYLVGWIW